MYCQTTAIINYCLSLAKLSNLTDIKEFRVNMIVDTGMESYEGFMKPAFMGMQAATGN